MRVCVVTTSYPRFPGDVAGVFVAEQVEALRAAGVEVEVVSPADVRHFGIAYGDGIVQNLRAQAMARRRAAAVPLRARTGGAPRRPRRRRRPRPLAPLGPAGARGRQAVRPAGLGDRRRARAAGPPGSSARSFAARGPSSRPRRSSRRPRRARRPRGARDPERRRDPGRGRPARTSRRTSSTSAA